MSHPHHEIFTGGLDNISDSTPTPLTAQEVEVQNAVTIVAHKDNVGYVYIGNVGITQGGATSGFPLRPNDGITVPAKKVGLVYALSEAGETNNSIMWISI